MCRYARSIQCLAAVSFLLFYFTDHTRGKCAASILGCCVCCCLKFSHWIHMAFCLLVFSSSIDASVLVLYSFFFFVFSFISISSGAHTHNHALSWSFLIACKIWFYCWCGVAAHIMFMCARWRFVFFPIFHCCKVSPKQTMQSCSIYGWRVVGRDLVKSVCRQWHVGDGRKMVCNPIVFACVCVCVRHSGTSESQLAAALSLSDIYSSHDYWNFLIISI